MVGTLVAMMTVILGMAISRYVPKSVILQIRHIIPQSFVDNFKRDPLGTLKNIKMPTNLDQLKEMIPEKLFNQTPSVDNATTNVTAPDHVEHVKIEPAPAPAPEPVHVPEPAVTPPLPEPVRQQVIELPVSPPTVSEDMGIVVHRSQPAPLPVTVPEPEALRQFVPLPEQTPIQSVEPEPLRVFVPLSESVIMPGQIPDEDIHKPPSIQLDMNQFVSAIKAPSRTSSSILQINTEDLAAVRAFLDAKGTTHNVLG
jgi:hypothetical protein